MWKDICSAPSASSMEFLSSVHGEVGEAAEYSKVYIVALGLAFREAFKSLPSFFQHLLGKRIIGIFVFAQHLEYYYFYHTKRTSSLYIGQLAVRSYPIEKPHIYIE